MAPGQEPVLLLRGGEAQGVGVAVLEGPPSSHGRKVWRFRFTYAITESGRVPFSATLKCKAGLQVSVSSPLDPVMPPCWSPPLAVAAWWVCPTLPVAEPSWEKHPIPKELGAPSPVPLLGCRFHPHLISTYTSTEHHHLRGGPGSDGEGWLVAAQQ